MSQESQELPGWALWLIAMLAAAAFIAWFSTGRFVSLVIVMVVGGTVIGLAIFFGSIIEAAWRARRKS